MERIQFKINNRIFAVEVNDNLDYETKLNEAHLQLIEQIKRNNETIQNIFFQELEIVCSSCGISLNNEEELIDFKCLQCANKEDIKNDRR